MPVVRWTFYDPILLETWTFDINPNTGGSPSFEKKINYESTTAPDGKTLIYEGTDEVQTIEWSGVILSQGHYETYIDWWQKRRQILLTDDLGRQFWIYIKTFTPKRVRSALYPWKHDYDVRAVILDWVS